MVRQTASTIILEIIGGLILLALLAVGVLAFMLANGPVELGIFRDDVERALTSSRDGRPVELEKVYLEWSPSEKRITVTADGVTFRNNEGDVGASAKRAEIVLDASSLIFGKIEPLEMHLKAGELLAEQSEGGWSVAGEPPFPIILPEGELPTTPVEVLEMANRGLQASLGTLRAINENQTFEAVSFENFVIVARNSANEDVVRVNNAKGTLNRNEEEISLLLAADGGDGLPERLLIGLSAPADFGKIEGQVGLEGWSLEALTKQFGLPKELLRGDVSGLSFNAAATTGGGLQQAGLELKPSTIAVKTESQALDFKVLGFDAKYNVETDDINLELTALEHERVSGPAMIELSDVLHGAEGARSFEITSEDLALDLTPMFESAWQLSDVSVTGKIDIEKRRLVADTAAFKTGGLDFRGAGKAALLEKSVETDLPFALEATARLKGPASPEMVLNYWPVKLGKGARDFTRERILEATLDEAEVMLNIRQDSFAQKFLADDALLATFSASDVKIQFLDDVPPVLVPNGSGRLTGNSFKAIASEGSIATVALTDGIYELPQMNPKGGDFRVYAKAAGEVRDIVKIVSDSRLQIQTRTGFDPDTLSGSAEGELELFRPALKSVAPDALRFTAKGNAKGAGLKAAAYGIDLTDASTKIEVNETSMTISGFGQWGAMPVQFSWRDGFNDGDAPSSLSATSIIDPDVMNRFGFLGRAYLTGEAPVEIQALTDGSELVEANVAIDLFDARLDIAELGWGKPVGKPGRARISFKPSEGTPVTTAFFESDDLLIDGDFVLGAGNRLLSANLRRAFVDDVADVFGTVKRTANGGLDIKLEGEFLDISGAMGGVGGGDEFVRGGVSLEADVQKMRLREGVIVSGAKVELENTDAGLQTFRANGELSDKSVIDIAYEGRNSRAPRLDISAGNAGFMTEAFLGDDFISGGTMTVSGTLGYGELPTRLDIQIKDARLRNAPFLTQILSLASLRGLADTLSGEGVLFSNIEVPLTIAGERYTVKGARAQGPALGLTANGWIRTDGQALRVDGVLVPSFGINSALGGVPILGDLFVSREGEGVFSLTYGVRGSLAEANVTINPLSAITPGVLRRVFENPADEPLPEGDPNVAPPPPVAPLPPPEEF